MTFSRWCLIFKRATHSISLPAVFSKARTMRSIKIMATLRKASILKRKMEPLNFSTTLLILSTR